MEKMYQIKKPSRIRQITAGVLLVLFIGVWFLLENFRWVALIPVLIYPVYSYRRNKQAGYTVTDQGDLIINKGALGCGKEKIDIQTIETIEYSPRPGRKAPVMLQTKNGFVFLNPEMPEGLIDAMKQVNPAITVAVEN